MSNPRIVPIDWEAYWGKLNQNSFGFETVMGIRASVFAAFPAFTTKFESRLNCMYLDDAESPGPYVTTGVGFLIDPVESALLYNWRHKSDNSPATAQEIAGEWHMVKSRTDLAPHGGNVFQSITTLKLTEPDIDNILRIKMKVNETEFLKRYSNIGQWPADAQMGIMSMSWALGPSFNFPKFKAATDNLDFVTAAAESKYHGQGSAPRIAANLILFNNAATVQKYGMDKDKIWYPGTASPGAAASGGTLGPIAKTIAIGGIGYIGYQNRHEILSWIRKITRGNS